jgi:hypothetical protein
METKNIDISYSTQTKAITLKGLNTSSKGEEITLPSLRGRGNEELLQYYGYTLPSYEDSVIMLDFDLNMKDPYLALKQKIFFRGFIANKSSDYAYAIRTYNPKFPLEVERIITPFRIKVYVHDKSYLEKVT